MILHPINSLYWLIFLIFLNLNLAKKIIKQKNKIYYYHCHNQNIEVTSWLKNSFNSYYECFPLLISRRTVLLLLPLHPDGHLVWRRSFIGRRRSILPVCVHPGQNCCHTGHIWPGAGGAGSWVVYRVQTRSQIWPNIVILFIKTSTVGLLQNIIKAANKKLIMNP